MSLIANSLRRSTRSRSAVSLDGTSSLKRARSRSLVRGNSNTSLTLPYYSSTPRRMSNTVRASNRIAILAVGEELRLLLHAENPPLIKDRRYHLRTYENCFMGHEMVDWLLKKGEVESRLEAVTMMKKLLENGVIHHVCDDHDFKDEKLFYRFRRDDGTYEEPVDSAIVAKGQRLYGRLKSDGSNLIQDRKYHFTSFKQCFIGREFVDWLITRGEANTREEATDIGRQLVDAGVFRHVCEDHHFKDEFLYYRFKNDEKPSKNALGRLKKSKRPGSATLSSSDANERTSVASFDSAIYAGDNHLSAGSSNTPPPDDDDEYIPMHSHSPSHQSSEPEQPYVQMHQMQPPTLPVPNRPTPQAPASPQPERQTSRRATVEELLDPSGNYMERKIDVVSDPVGYGFVIRGSRPVYVHTVDPSGPAAAAGLQVGEYLHFVNGQDVLDKSHTDVARIILMGASTASLVSFIEKDRLS